MHYALSGILTEVALISWRRKNGSYILLLPPNFPPRCRLRLRKNAHSSRGAEPPANDLHSENLLHCRSRRLEKAFPPPRPRPHEKVNATSAYATIFGTVCSTLLTERAFQTKHRILRTKATELKETLDGAIFASEILSDLNYIAILTVAIGRANGRSKRARLIYDYEDSGGGNAFRKSYFPPSI